MRWFPGEPGACRWWHRRRGVAAGTNVREEVPDLVAECEAFLVGSYVELLDGRAEPVPVWAWTNVLAHGSREDIDRAAMGAQGGWTSSRRWRSARAFVAGELQDALSRGVSLTDVQRDALVPLELELVSLRGVWAWTPQQWLEAVRAALRSYRSSNRT
ncbi:MAG TPA: hypothetical protein VMD28_07425 [Acidimicrobiales bacterium]|nr:hypothetical protein [Acidimicrobiales bacterium]